MTGMIVIKGTCGGSRQKIVIDQSIRRRGVLKDSQRHFAGDVGFASRVKDYF